MPGQTQDMSPDFARCWASIFAGSDELVFAIDAQRRILAVSDGLTRRLGSSAGDVVGHACADLTHEDGSVPAHCPLQELLLDAGQHEAEVHCELLGGDFLVRVTPVLAENGELECAVHSMVETTERHRVEEALRRSEAHYRAYFDQGLVGAAASGADGILVDVNQAMCDMLGYGREELLGRSWADLTHPDDRAGDLEHAGRVAAGKTKSHRLEKRFVRKDGEVVIADLSLHAERAPDGHLERFLALFSDITERRRMEEDLRRSEERYRLLAEHVSDVVFEGADGGLTWISPSVTALSGWLPEQLLGMPLAEVIHPDDLPRVAAARERASGAVAGRCEARMRFANGEYQWLSLVLENVVDSSGRQTLIGSARDVHEQVEAREALAESERRYRALSETSPDFVFVYDRELRVRYLNSTSVKAFRRTPEELTGAGITELFDAVIADRMSSGLRRVFESGEARHAELEWLGPWGQKWLATWLVPIKDEAGAVAEVFGVSRDVTDLKQAQSELAALNAELEQRVEARTAELNAVNEELEAFVYAVSHDLRAPLRAIDGFSQVVVDDHAEALGDAGRADLQRVRAAAQKMGQLIDALLALSRLGRRELNLGKVDLSRLAADIVAGLRERDPERTVRVTIAPGCTVTGDAQLLEVVLSNLLGNAWKFTSLRADARIDFGEASPDGGRVFSVRDNGAGFDPAYAGKLFQPFQRLHAGEDFPGTGIGLATVQRIVTRLGGRVWAEAELGRGATFFFALPDPAAGA